MCAAKFFSLDFCNTQRQQINPSLLRTFDAIAHVRSTTDVGGGFLTSEHRLHPGKEGVPPLSNHGWPAHHPTKPCPIMAKITSEDRSPHPARGRDKNRRAPLSARWSWVGIVREERGRHCSWCASLVVVIAVSQAGPLTIPQPLTSISHFVEQ